MDKLLSRSGWFWSSIHLPRRNTNIPTNASPSHNHHTKLVRSGVWASFFSHIVVYLFRSLVTYRTLTDIKLEDIHSLRTALTILHTTYNVQNVVISSIPLKPWLTAILPNTVRAQITPAFSEYLLCISSTKTPQNSIVHTCAVPCLPGYFSGVGDLFSALVLAHFDHTQQHPPPMTALSVAATLALTKTHSILTLTHTCALALPSEDRTITDDDLDLQDPSRKIRRMRGRELRLVQGQEILRKGYNDKFDLLRKMELWQEFWELPLTQ